MRRVSSAVLPLILGLAACLPATSASPAPTPALTASPGPIATASSTVAPSATEAPSATATAEPHLSLDLPEGTDSREVSVSVQPDLGSDGGEIIVSVTSLADERIDELVLRWPAELNASIVLAPFIPSESRTAEGGEPLVQEWTKWVLGPGEQGEPAGTISLGYGPLLPGASLNMPLYARRLDPGPVAFDLQVLAGGDLLKLDGGPAELRVEIP